jgi:hypothetical protein
MMGLEVKMSSNIRNILERLDRGELDSEAAVQALNLERGEESGNKTHFLRVNVSRLHDDQPRVNIKIPLSVVGLGLALGSRYAPELNGLDLDQIVDDLRVIGDGTIIEVQDIEEDEHVLISIEST